MKRATCPNHPGRLIDKHPCGVCGYSLPEMESSPAHPPLSLVQNAEQEAEVGVELLPNVEADIDTVTGEITGQLTFGLDVPYIAQRRAEQVMTEREFNGRQWGLEEGDRLTVAVKDGKWNVTHKTGWRMPR